MEDKEIIDDVDVAGCVRLQDDKISCDLGGECKGWESCYYKQLKRLEQDKAELKAENERLKEEIKEVKKYQYEQEFLEKEIEEQREKNKRLTCKILEVKALNETLNVQCTSQDCTQLRKLHKTLQEIKKYIAKICKEECGYVQKKRCPDCDCRYGAILDLITKAEEE